MPERGRIAKSKEAPLRVLIVDHQRLFAESLAQVLANERGISVLGTTPKGSDASDLADRLRPKVVLVRYVTPDHDGVAVTALIKRRDPEIMVVMLTESTEDQVLLAAIDAGCSGFLTRDRSAVEVADAVRLAAVGEAVISPESLARLLPKLERAHRAVGPDLTEREHNILAFLARGWTSKAIASELFLSLNTVRNHTQKVLIKLGAHSKLEAVATAVREGIIADRSRP